MQLPSASFVASIIDTGRTSRKVRLNAWQTLDQPGVKQRREKANLLLQAGIGQAGLDKALVQEVGGRRDPHIVKLLLDQKASCDYDGGKSLALALRYHDGDILEQLVSNCSNHRTLQAMVPNASAVQEAQTRLRCLSLLIYGGATGRPLSQALLQEVEASEHRAPQVIQFLVDHGAEVDYLEGKSITFAISAPLDVDILKILVSTTAASRLMATLIPLALKHPQDVRLSLLQLLLSQDVDEVLLNEALVMMVSEGTTAQPTINLLLKHGAPVDYDRAQAMKIAARAKSILILNSLLKQNPNHELLEEAIPAAMQLPPRPSALTLAERLHTVRLLTQKLNTPSAANEPLIQAVEEEDNTLIEHWIMCVANPNFRKGRCVVIATQKLNITALQCIFRSKIAPTSETCSRAFAAILADDSRWHAQDHLIQSVDRILILGGAAGAPVDQTFLSALKSPQELAAKFVMLILHHRTPLDVNFEEGKASVSRLVRLASRL